MFTFIRKFLFSTTILLGVLFFGACEYEPTGQNVVDVDQDVPPLIFDAKLNWDKDTVWLPGNQIVELTFDFSNSNKKFIVAKMTVDSSRTRSYYLPVGSFGIGKLENGLPEETQHVMLQITYHSGTGSMADSLKAEVYIVQKEWILIRYDAEKIQLPPLDIKEIDGSLKISWENPFMYDVKNYRLYISSDSIFKYYDESFLYDSLDTDYVYDNYTMGEAAYYRLIVTDSYDDRHEYPVTYYKGHPIKIYSKKIDDYKYRLFWDKSTFYTNFDRYSFHVEKSNETYDKITNINDTSIIVDKHYLGVSKEYSVSAASELTAEGFRRAVRDKIIVSNGEDFPEFEYMFDAGKDYLMYRTSDYYFYLYDIENDIIIDSIPPVQNSARTIRSSLNGKYLVYLENENVKIIEDLNISNPRTLSTKKVTNGAINPKPGIQILEETKVSDKGMLTVRYDSTIYFYNLDSDKFEFSYKFRRLKPGYYNLSSEGNYLYVSSGHGACFIYNVNDNDMTVYQELEKFTHIYFFPNSHSRVLIHHYNDSRKIEILDLETNTKITELDANIYRIKTDLYSDRFVSNMNDSIVKYKVSGMELLNNIPSVSDMPNSYRLFYKNNMVYLHTGLKFRVED